MKKLGRLNGHLEKTHESRDLSGENDEKDMGWRL